jgi:hypothetical protein
LNVTNRRPKSRLPVISSTLRFPTPYYLTHRPNPLSSSCLFLSSSLLRGPYRLPLTGRQSRRTAAGGTDTGILRHRLGLGLQKIQSSSTKMTKKGTECEPQSAQYPILSDDRDDIPQHDNTVLESDSRPSVRPCRPCFAARARVTSSRAVVVIPVKGAQPPSRRWRMLPWIFSTPA